MNVNIIRRKFPIISSLTLKVIEGHIKAFRNEGVKIVTREKKYMFHDGMPHSL